MACVIGGIVAHRQRKAIGTDSAYQRRTTSLHRFDGVRRLVCRTQGQGDEFMRQAGLNIR